jgi:putative oxidoreductase
MARVRSEHDSGGGWVVRTGPMDTHDVLVREDRKRPADAGGWVLRGGVAAFFILVGAEKFPSTPGSPWIGIFQQIGLGEWFRYFTGVAEICGGLLFVPPATNRIGATILSCTMIGAMAVHIVIRHSVAASLYPAIVLLAVLAIAMRRPDDSIDTTARRLFPRR